MEQVQTKESKPNQKMCMTVREMAEELGIGLNTAYALVNSVGFPMIRFGDRKIRIPRASLEKWLDKQTGEE